MVETLLASAAGLLLLSGCRKLASPGGLRRALQDTGLNFASWFVRVFAIGEVSVAVVSVVASPVVGGALVGLFGIVFIVFGLVGLLSGSTVPCGCFGTSRTGPIGARSIAFGVGLAVVGATRSTQSIPAGEHATEMLLGMCCIALALSVLIDRRWLVDGLRSITDERRRSSSIRAGVHE